jgi:hypothetical protein
MWIAVYHQKLANGTREKALPSQVSWAPNGKNRYSFQNQKKRTRLPGSSDRKTTRTNQKQINKTTKQKSQRTGSKGTTEQSSDPSKIDSQELGKSSVQKSSQRAETTRNGKLILISAAIPKNDMTSKRHGEVPS